MDVQIDPRNSPHFPRKTHESLYPFRRENPPIVPPHCTSFSSRGKFVWPRPQVTAIAGDERRSSCTAARVVSTRRRRHRSDDV